jgi:hypothetical protein
MSEILDFEKNQNKVPEHKKHYRALMNKPLLVAEEFGGKDVTLTIKEVKQETLKNERGEEQKIVLYFEETPRAVAMNVTNCKQLTENVGSGFVQDWVGQKVTFYPVTISAFGRNQEAIRIRPKK